jgi:hypothetical protein
LPAASDSTEVVANVVSADLFAGRFGAVLPPADWARFFEVVADTARRVFFFASSVESAESTVVSRETEVVCLFFADVLEDDVERLLEARFR